jgi:hypothetical protein
MERLSRRKILRAAGALAGGSVVAGPAIAAAGPAVSSAAAADPVIAMIAEEERLRDRETAYDQRLHDLIRANPSETQSKLYAQIGKEALPEPMAGLYRECARLSDAANELAIQIEATKPTTVEGAAAMLKWATVGGDNTAVDTVIAGLQIIAKGAAA